MTTDQKNPTTDMSRLNQNLARIEALSARLVAALSDKKEIPTGLQAPGQDLFLKAASAWMSQLMSDPEKILQQQTAFWSDTLRYATQETDAQDRRFSHPLWEANPYYKMVKAQFMAAQDAMEANLANMQGLQEGEKSRLDYFARAILDLYAPSNFLATNPQALTRAVETEGQSLVDGLENMVRDLEANNGQLLVSLCDPDAFEVGKDLATTDGAVVFRNRMFELIQYAPRSKTVCETPIVLFPPWINKFYVLDLKQENSLIHWIVEQGFTLFVVSWVNPDARLSDAGVDTYIEEGFLTAIAEVKSICGVKKVNATGYCIGGTTLALTLALMQKRGDESVNAATFFTTLTDFSDPGEVGVFLSNDFIDGIEAEVAKMGYLDALYISRTFSFLRANDLIYTPAIKSYLLGEAPAAFDLLFWNGDSTNLPARMAVEYLRGLCQGNEFANEGFSVLGEDLRLSDVQVPLCAIACETDHIAPWHSSYQGFRAMGSQDKSFILSESGHIAGIVNPPSKLKYGHYTADNWPDLTEKWLKSASFHQGSWWGRWGEWLCHRSGKKVPARAIRKENILAPAPGTYVTNTPKNN